MDELFISNFAATIEIYTLSLHDALPISTSAPASGRSRASACSCCRHGARSDDLGDRKRDRKSTRLNSSHVEISYAVFCLKKKRISKPSITVSGQTLKNLMCTYKLYIFAS